MIVQHSFKQDYTSDLEYRLTNTKELLPLYSHEKFPFDESQTVLLPGIERPNGLLKKMIPTSEGDFQSAIALYEAFPKLTPLQAADNSFWIYLAHVDLFSYVQQRFPKVLEIGFDKADYVKDHWFKRGNVGNILKRHWFSVYCSIDESIEDKYRYTRILFTDYATRTNNFIGYSISRHKEASIGILKFLYDNDDVRSTAFRGRVQYITKYFNRMGGYKCLVALDKEFFYNELMRIKEDILKIKSQEDARDAM